MKNMTANDINTGLLEKTRFGNGYTCESVDEHFELIKSLVSDLEKKNEQLEKEVHQYKSDANLFQNKKDELANAILDAQNVKEQKLNEAKVEIGRELSEAKGRVKNANIEASRILSEAKDKAENIKSQAEKYNSELAKEANSEFDKKMGEAEARANKLIEDAKNEADKILHSAESETQQLIECAKDEARNITSTASAKAATVIEETERIEKVNEKMRLEMKDTVKSIIEPTINEFKDAILLLEQVQKDAVNLINNKLTKSNKEPKESKRQKQLVNSDLTTEQKEALENSQKVIQETQEFLNKTVVKSSDDPLASAKILMEQLEKS